jgi:SAM-dependent methyltransferase
MTDMDTREASESNAQQAAEWDGPHGEYWATHADEYERCTAAHLDVLLRTADIRRDSRVLDVGCGSGLLARRAARIAADGAVLGIDLSARLVEVAQQRADYDGVSNVSFEQGDAQIHAFDPRTFDLVLGLTSAMFFGDKAAALANLARALRDGGRLGLITWQSPARNPWFVAFMSALAVGRELPAPPPDGPHPFSMADPDHVRPMVERAGFTDVHIDALEAPMWFGATATQAQQFMLGQFGWLLDDLGAADQQHAKDALLATLENHASPDGVQYPSAAWLITGRRA